MVSLTKQCNPTNIHKKQQQQKIRKICTRLMSSGCDQDYCKKCKYFWMSLSKKMFRFFALLFRLDIVVWVTLYELCIDSNRARSLSLSISLSFSFSFSHYHFLVARVFFFAFFIRFPVTISFSTYFWPSTHSAFTLAILLARKFHKKNTIVKNVQQLHYNNRDQ